MPVGAWTSFSVVFFILTFTLILWIIIGNSAIIVVLVKHRNLHCRKNALIGSLAVSDFCVGIYDGVDLMLHYFGYSRRLSNSTVLNYGSVLLISNGTVSFLHLLAIGLDRYIAITKPLHYRSLITNRVIVVVITLCWLIPYCILCPVYVMNMEDSQQNMQQFSLVHNTMVVATYVAIALILLVFYVTILCIARTHSNRVQEFRVKYSNTISAISSNDNPHNTTSGVNQNSRRGVRLVLGILLSYLLLCLPFVIHACLRLHGVQPTIKLFTLEMMGQILVVCNSGSNVLLYAAAAVDFRKAFKSEFCCVINTDPGI